MYTLKNVLKTCDCENGRIMTARKVVTPPFRIAGPRFTRAVLVLSVRVPGHRVAHIISHRVGFKISFRVGYRVSHNISYLVGKIVKHTE